MQTKSSEGRTVVPARRAGVARAAIFFGSTDTLVVLAALVLSLVSGVWFEKIKTHGGFGMDGVHYGKWAKDFHKSLFVDGLSDYEIQKSLPSAIVHYGLRLCRVPPSDENVIHGFIFLNVAAITLAALTWVAIANHLGIGSRGKWFGFVALFLNHAVLKFASYYPVQTDTVTFFAGTLMVYLYLKERLFALASVTLVSSFATPTMLLEGCLLLGFPRRIPIGVVSERARTAAATVSSGVVALLAFYFGTIWQKTRFRILGPIEPIDSLLPLSILLALGFLFFAVRELLVFSEFHLLASWKRLVSWNLLIAAFVFGLQRFAVHQLAARPHPSGTGDIVRLVFSSSVGKPAIFFLSHTFYFGPAVMLIAMLWPRVAKEISGHGIGLIAAVVLLLVLSLDAESRHLSGLYPLVVPFLVCVFPLNRFHPAFDAGFAFLSLFFSKVWILLEGAPVYGDPLRLVDQLYYMNHGIFMTTPMYVIHLSVAVPAAAVLWLVVRRVERPSPIPVVNPT
jgi:hypothetical protein